MKLMTKALANTMPKLLEQEWKGKDAIVYAHYFYGSMDRYALEFDWENEFFWIVIWNEIEYGYFHLSELESVRVVERDLYFEPTKVWDIDKLQPLYK